MEVLSMKSTTIVNHLNTDRVVEITISENKYIIFTLMYRNIIVVKTTNADNPVLLLNRNCNSRKVLSDTIDDIIIKASVSIDSNDFESYMDTYIELNDITNNDTTKEILEVYKILTEDYNL
jgi:hypothetical protein